MKRFFCIALSLALFCGQFFLLPANALEMNTTDNYSEEITFIRSFLWTFDHENKDVKFIKKIKDIDKEESFLLFSLDTDGYAIMTKNNRLVRK